MAAAFVSALAVVVSAGFEAGVSLLAVLDSLAVASDLESDLLSDLVSLLLFKFERDAPLLSLT